jgi:hypothetical protein
MDEQLAKEYVVIYLPFFKWEFSIEFDTDYFPFLKDKVK